jgi:5-methylcytosine-specific restriction endonuclease McrA
MGNMNTSQDGTISRKVFKTRIHALADAQDGLCFYCDKPVVILNPNKPHSDKAYGDFRRATWDHVVPKSQGGGRGNNLVIAHALCNADKGDTPPTEDMLERLAILNLKRAHLFELHKKLEKQYTKMTLFRGDTFSEPTPSMLVLSKLLNDLEGQDGQRFRNRATTLLQTFLDDLKSLQDIKKKSKMEKFCNLALDKALLEVAEFPTDIQTYLANVMKIIRGRSLGYRKEVKV